jgi:hypothetical protein
MVGGANFKLILPIESGHLAKRLNYRKAEVNHDRKKRENEGPTASTHT